MQGAIFETISPSMVAYVTLHKHNLPESMSRGNKILGSIASTYRCRNACKWYRLSLLCVGNFGNRAQISAAIDCGERDRVNRPAPINWNPIAMWMAICEPYVTCELFGPSRLRSIRHILSMFKSPVPAFTKDIAIKISIRHDSTVDFPAYSPTYIPFMFRNRVNVLFSVLTARALAVPAKRSPIQKAPPAIMLQYAWLKMNAIEINLNL